MLFNNKLRYFVIACIFFQTGFVVAASKSVPMQTLEKEKSLYHDVYLLGNDDLQCIGFASKKTIRLMGCEYKKTPNLIFNPFNQMLLSALYINPQPKRVLMIGLGVGALPKTFDQLLPAAQVDVVEIDPVVLRMAQAYFNFKESKNLHAIVEDGRVYIKRAIKEGKKYDMVLLDAYNADYIPEHLLTKEFLQEVKQLLTPQGVVAANTFSSSALYPNESATYAAVFGKFYNLKNTEQVDNRIVLATNGNLPGLEVILSNAVMMEDALNQFGVTREWLVPLMMNDPDWPANARILTDQYSPANLLNSQKP